MPPENTDPVAKTQPAELDFDAPPTENPRIKKRSLKARATTPPTQSAAAAQPEPARAPATPDQPRPTGYVPPAATSGTSNPTGYTRPGAAPAAEKPQPAAPSGVLYYSNGPQKDAAPKTAAPAAEASHPATAPTQPASQRPATSMPMPTSSTSRPASTPQHTPNRPPGTTSHTAQQAPASRPAGATASQPASAPRTVSTTVAAPAAASRPGGVSDYRANIDRQSREQKSIGGILNLIVYALIAIFILGAGLAAYGAHVIFRQIHEQSLTVNDLDSRYSAANQQLAAQLKTTAQAVLELQTQVSRDQELAIKQQDTIGKVQASLATDTEALRQERAARSTETSIRISETAALRARLRTLENRESSTYRP